MKEKIRTVNYGLIVCSLIVIYMYYFANIFTHWVAVLLLIIIAIISWFNTLAYYKYNKQHPSDKIKIMLKYHQLSFSICITLVAIAIALYPNVIH